MIRLDLDNRSKAAVRVFLLSAASTSALLATLHPIQCVSGGLFTRGQSDHVVKLADRSRLTVGPAGQLAGAAIYLGLAADDHSRCNADVRRHLTRPALN